MATKSNLKKHLEINYRNVLLAPGIRLGLIFALNKCQMQDFHQREIKRAIDVIDQELESKYQRNRDEREK
jgi:hypothetical protein